MTDEEGKPLPCFYWNEQGEGVRKLLMAKGYREVSTYRDLAGLDRVTVGYVPETVEEC